MGFSIIGLFELIDEVHEAKKKDHDGDVRITLDESFEIIRDLFKTMGWQDSFNLTKFLGK